MRHMRSRRILAMLLALSMIFGLLTTTALADNEVDQNTSNVGESTANGTSAGGSGEGQSSGASEGEPSEETNKKDVPTEEETTPEEKKTTSSEEGDPQAGEGENPTEETTYVASIGEQGYASLDAAIQAVQDNDIIVVSAGEYTLNGSLTYTNKAFTIKAADGETVSFDMSAAVALHGAKITFEGVTFNYKTNGNYIGLQHTDTLVYNNCVINGMVFLYATNETFNNCTFNQTSADAYNVWTYGAKNVAFNSCTFNCVGKSVLVYNEGANAKTDLTVMNTQFIASSPVAGKAAIEIDTSLMAEGAEITIDADTKAEGFAEGSKSGNTLWNDKKQTADTNKNTTVTVAGETVFAPKSEGVAKVGNETFDTLEKAFAALNSTNYTLELLDENAWTGENVYWAAGEQNGYEATLAAALTEAYKADAGNITIVCRPGADVGTMTHSHVADNLTIYGNNAYISAGECDLEVDTFMYSRETGKQVTENGEYLGKDITITAYELDNLGVWGQRNTNNTVNVNLTDCDTVHDITVQRVYISGTTGTNNITLTGCDFGTKATSVYSNADGEIKITNCSFTGAQVPVNFNHKANGEQTVTVTNSTFTNCGDTVEWPTFAAPVRFVNSGSGTQSAAVDTCTFTGTVGTNGDILIGDGRTGEKSNDVSLTVTNTEATVMAQKPGYYTTDGATDDTLKGKKKLTASESLTNASIDSLIGGTTATKGTEANPYTLEELGAMTRDAYIAAQKELNGTMYVTVGDYSYDTDGVLGNGVRDDTPGQIPDHSKLNAYGENGYLGEKNDGANGLNIVFVNGSITSGVTGYTSIDKIGTSLLLAVPAYTNVTFKGITFKNVMCFNYQLYTSPWSQLGELKFDGCTFNGIIIGSIAAQTLTFNGCEFTNYTNSDSANNSNPTWIRPAYGNWTESDNEGQGTDFRSLTTINFTNNTVTSTRPVKFEFISQWNNTTTLTATGNSFDISAQESDTETKNVGLYIGPHTDKNAVKLVLDNNTKSEGTAALYVIPSGKSKLPVGSTVTDLSGNPIEITDALEWKTTTKVTLKTEPVPTVKNVAKVGDTEYATLKEAIANAEAGQTVTLIENVNTPETTYVVSKDLTIDLNGKTVTGSGYDGVFQINGADAKVLIENGNVVAVEQSGSAGKYAMAVWACAENCEVTLQNLKVTQKITHTDDKQMDMIYTSKGTIIIDSGFFESGTPAWTLNCKDAAFKDGSAKIIVNGGTFTGFDPCNNAAEGKGTSFVAEGVGVDYDENGSFTAKAGMVAQVLDASGNSVKAYKTLAEAFTEASEGQTVRLLKDLKEDVEITKNITLDLGGKTLTNTGKGNATITIAKDATATVKNGSVVGGTSYYNIQNNGTATFEGLTATAGNDGSSMIDNYGTLTITSGEYTGGLDTIKNEPNAKLTVDGGTFTLTKGTGDGFTGVIFNYGELTINDGTFIQNDKSAPYGQAQVIHTDKSGSNLPSTVIKGGTFKNLCTAKTAWTVRATNAAAGATKVSGGSFNTKVQETYCADGFIPTKNADGTYGVKEGKYVATTGKNNFETLEKAVSLVAKNGKITLLADVDANIEIGSAKNFTLDLNGHTINGGTVKDKATITNYGTVTITDSSAAQNGTIKRDDNGTVGETSFYVIRNIGTMTIEQANVTNNSGYRKTNPSGSMVGSSLICNGDDDLGGTLNISGGKFEQKNFIAIKNGALGKLNVTSGTISSDHSAIQNWFEATITGGEINGQLWTDAYIKDESVGHTTIGGNAKYTGEIVMDISGSVKPTLEISGGTLDVTNWRITTAASKAGAKPAVSGGTFTKAVSADYCAEGFEPKDNGDGTFGVKEISAAKIGNVEYETLAAAFAAAKDGETIVLLKNSSGNGIQVNTEKFVNQGLTVDFNGHTYTVGGVLVGSTGTGTNAFQLLAGGKVTFMNGSIVGVAEGTKPAEDTPNWHGAPAMMIQNYCDLTLQNMTISGGDETVYTMSNNHGNVVIKDTTINAGKAKGSSYSPYAFDVCGYSSYTGVSVSVENSTINGNIELSKSKGNTYDATLTLGSGTTVNGSISVGDNGDKVAVTKDNSVDVAAPDGYKWVDGETGQTLAKIVMVAEVNGTGYETLAEAFAAATDNSTIKLLTDITLEGTTGLKVKAENAMNIVFDLNGHSITGSALSATTPALYIVSACGRDMSGSVKIINSSTEKAAISAKLPLQIFGSSYADEVRVEIDENVTLEVLEGGTNAIKMVQSAAYLVATEHTKTFYKNGGFMTTVNDEERIHEELSSAQKFSKNVKLLNDFATSSYLKIWDSWGAVTLDLDGHTYKSTAKVNMFELQEGANITFKKGTLKGSGDCVIGMPYNNSTLTLDSVAVENTGNFGIATNGTTTNQTVTINNSTIKVPNGMGVYFPSTGKLTINGGSIEANTGVQICAGSLEITGNPTIKATATAAEAISSGSILDGAAVSIVGGRSGYGAMGQVTIDSGSFTSASGIEAVQAYTVNSNNQKADWTDAEAKVNISGGSYSTPVRENLCAEGFVPVTKANADGLYEVTKDTSEAKIGDTKFATLADALKVATSGNTIVLLNDVTHATGFVLNDGILIDLNGHNLTTPFIFTSIEGGAGIIDSSNNANGGSGTLKLMFKKTTLNGISRTAKNSAGTADISGYFFPVFTGETTNEGTTWYNYKIYWGYVYSWPNSGTSTVDSIKFSFSVIFRNREAYQYFVNDPEQINVWFDVLLGNTEGGQQSNMSFKFTTDHIKTTWAQATINANGGVVRFNLTFKGLSEYAGATVYGTPYAQSNYTNASMNGSQLTATVQEQG